MHANGASFFFLLLYAHIGRGIYFGSYTNKATWLVGVLLLLLVMATAFLGYVLPWGQISFWGATVITNLFSAIPYVGHTIVSWLWGGFSVENATLTRFYSLHFLLPFVISGSSILHIFYLHQTGSNNPLGVTSHADKLPFHWYYRVKDIVGFLVLIFCIMFIVFFYPLLLSEADNFIPANPLVTPPHILPEWYFLFAYSILRTITSKLGGVLALVSSILVLLTLSHTHFQAMKGLSFYGPVKGYFWRHVTVFILLTVGGSWPVSLPFTRVILCLSFLYFVFYFLIFLFRHFWDGLLI